MNIPLETFSIWLKNKNLKERTIENYVYYFNKFTFQVFNQETVSRFMAMKGNRNSIARSFLVNFHKFLMVNYQELGLSQDARINLSEIELPKLTGRTKQRLVNVIPHEQIILLENQLEDEKLKIMLLLNYYCALRLGELLKIKIISFNWDEWKKDPEKMGECRVYGKGDKEGIALVPSFIMKRIARNIKTRTFDDINAFIFIRNATRFPNLRNLGRSYQLKLREAGIRAGITKLDLEGKPIEETLVHPHRLRHSYASYLLNVRGLNLIEVKEILRHTSVQSTQIYTHINKEYLKEKLETP